MSIAITITQSPCASNPCVNGGTCIVSQFSNTYTCTCGQYYYGTRCESMIKMIFITNILLILLDMNRCYSQPGLCQNGGTCVPGLNGAVSCRCSSLYMGVYCEQPTSML